MAADDFDRSLRARKMQQTKRLLQQEALRLFLERGYDATTVEDIAAAANVSDRTFFRYFPNKEAVLFDDDYEPALLAAISALPLGGVPLDVIRGLVHSAVAAIYNDDQHELLERARLTIRTIALRGRLMEDILRTERLVAAVIERITGHTADTFAVRAAAAACVGAFRVAFEQWMAGDGTRPLPELMDEALRPLRADLAILPSGRPTPAELAAGPDVTATSSLNYPGSSG